MDFVVIGLGLSALALLTGLTLLCMVAPRWFRKSRAVQPADAAFARALAGERHALGQGFLCVGAVLLLTTLGGISAGLADKAGAYLVAAMTTVAALGLYGWSMLYRRQHPVPQRRRAAPARVQPATAEVPATAEAATTQTGAPEATTTTVRRRVLPARRRIAPASQPVTATAEGVALEIEPAPESDVAHDEALEGVAEVAASLATASSEAAPGLESPEPSVAPGVQEAPSAARTEDTAAPVSDKPIVEDASDVAAELPEPVPFPPARANGAGEPAAASATETEPDLMPDGDDRVIALFPTAAARRRNMIVAPTDPDGKD